MIKLTSTTSPRRELYVAARFVIAVNEAMPNSNGTQSYVRMQDGVEYGVLEAASSISKAVFTELAHHG